MSPLRSIWISDVHLGTRDCRIDYLYDFLQHTDSEYLYLVGDIVDLWKLETGGCWPERNSELIRLVVAKARRGTRVVYIPGNHDASLRRYAGSCFHGVAIRREAEHRTALGQRLLIVHGDQFDAAVRVEGWKEWVGNAVYDGLVVTDRWLHRVRNRFGGRHWSLASWIKHHYGEAARYIAAFEQAAAHEAARRGYAGIVCGHIHSANISRINGVLYTNCGDWVEHCTALAEMPNGELQLIDWTKPGRLTAREPLRAVA